MAVATPNDYCDANALMVEVFETVMGREWRMPSDVDEGKHTQEVFGPGLRSDATVVGYRHPGSISRSMANPPKDEEEEETTPSPPL